MPRQIALLRGVNLGPRNRVRMADLRAALSHLGLADVRTHLQSGNAVFTSRASAARLERDIARCLADELGVAVPVVVRTRDELADVIARDPFGDVVDDPKRYQVSFLSGVPDRAVVEALHAADVAPERVVADGREIYAWHANGIQRSPLAKLLEDRRLGVTATARNWNTVTALLALADESGAQPAP